MNCSLRPPSNKHTGVVFFFFQEDLPSQMPIPLELRPPQQQGCGVGAHQTLAGC